MKTGSGPYFDHSAAWFSLGETDMTQLRAAGADGTAIFDQALSDARGGCPERSCKLSCVRSLAEAGLSAEFGCATDCTQANHVVGAAYSAASVALREHGVVESLQ